MAVPSQVGDVKIVSPVSTFEFRAKYVNTQIKYIVIIIITIIVITITIIIIIIIIIIIGSLRRRLTHG